MKMHFSKTKPHILSHRSYRNFKNVGFIGDLRSCSYAQNDILKKDGPNVFSSIYSEILNRYSFFRGQYQNHKSLINA